MKPFAIYFPQFYPTPTNNEAWGHGFTDWSLVAGANLGDIWQRRAPRSGFYDGASPAVHRSHMSEMTAAGLGGIALYHYWFYTHQELAAFENTLLQAAPSETLPWFLIWANEDWSRRWVGDATTLVRLSRAPTEDDIRIHAEHLLRCFAHPRYLRLNGKPLYAFYQLGHFDDPAAVLTAYRRCWTDAGEDVHIAQFVKKPFDIRYAALVESHYLFEPRLFFAYRGQGGGARRQRLLNFARSVFGRTAADRFLVWADRIAPRGRLFTAADFVRYMYSAERDLLRKQLGACQDVVIPGWNNAPRYRDRFTALEDLESAAFAELIRVARQREPALPPLINAWNEWAEGAAIEPCAYLGTRYIDALGGLVPARPEPSPTAEAQVRTAS